MSPLAQRVEKEVQVELNGTNCFLQAEHDYIFHGKLATPSKIFIATAMAAAEKVVFNELASGLDNGLIGCCNWMLGLHPDSNDKLYLLCTFNSSSDAYKS